MLTNEERGRSEERGGELEGSRETHRITCLNTQILRDGLGWNCSSTVFSMGFMVLIQIFYTINIEPVSSLPSSPLPSPSLAVMRE